METKSILKGMLGRIEALFFTDNGEIIFVGGVFFGGGGGDGASNIYF